MRKTASLLLGLSLCSFVWMLPNRADALGLDLEGRYWAPDINGSATLADLDLPPEIDVTGLLGLEADGVPEGRLTFRILLGFYVRAAYQTMSNSSERTIEDLIDLPIPIPIEGTARTALDVDYGRLALGWRFVFPKKIFNVNIFAEAKGFSGDASGSVVSPIFSDSIRESFEVVLPSVGAGAEINPSERFQIFGEASFEVGYDDASMADWELGLRFYPVSVFGIGAGYRVMDLDGIIDDVLLDVDWKGFFLSGLLRF